MSLSYIYGFLMPDKCYNESTMSFTMNAPCMASFLNNLARLGVFLELYFEPFPQLWKIIRNQSADGLNSTYAYLNLYVLACPVMFAVANNFPFDAWSSRLFSLIPAALILLLILRYEVETFKGLQIVLGFATWMTLLAFYAPLLIVRSMYKTAWIIYIISKLIQTETNYRNGHAGQLSGCSMLLACGGSLGFLYITSQGSDGFLSICPYILSTCLSFIMLFQVIRSRNIPFWDSRSGSEVDSRSETSEDFLKEE